VGVAAVAWLRLVAVPEVNAPIEDEIVATIVDDSSVAVLPFVNMSGNPDNEYFSDGLTETLLHMLAQVSELKVAARTSSFAFKGQDRDIREIADALDVAHVLEGSVQRSGDRVRITVQLIRANDGFHIWSENYDRTLDDIFGIQDEIAGRVGTALSASLLSGNQKLPIVGVGTSDVAAYDDYLHALSAAASGSFSGYREAEQALQAALAKDPDFVDAKVKLADVYISQSATGMTSRADAYRDAVSLLQQALLDRPDDINAESQLLQLKLSDMEN
jgi:TolB-like protein